MDDVQLKNEFSFVYDKKRRLIELIQQIGYKDKDWFIESYIEHSVNKRTNPEEINDFLTDFIECLLTETTDAQLIYQLNIIKSL